MSGNSEHAIRERAYLIWEREGRPQGRDFEHWVQAQVELTAEAIANNGGSKQATQPRARAATVKARPVSAPKTASRSKRA